MEQCFEMKGTTLFVRLPSEIDHHNAKELCAKADRLLKTNLVNRLVFDFSGTVFMDSSGIGMLMGRYKNMRFLGGDVVAVKVNERMRKILALSGIYKLIDIYEGYPEEMEGNGYAAK